MQGDLDPDRKGAEELRKVQKRYVTIWKPPAPQVGYRYAVSTDNPNNDSLPPSLVALVVVDSVDVHDAVAKTMLGKGKVLAGGRI